MTPLGNLTLAYPLKKQSYLLNKIVHHAWPVNTQEAGR